MELTSNLDVLKLLSSVVGLIGGFLGFFTFIDNNVLKFSPKLNISNRLFFSFLNEESHRGVRGKKLESLILQVEIINGRNKIGRIDDFSIRIYNERSTLPTEYMLYAEGVLDKLPSKSSFFDEGKFSSFSPVSIIGRSTKNIVIQFKPEKYRDITVSSDGLLKMDLLYFLPGKGWKFVGTFSPHYFIEGGNSQGLNGVVEYSLLDNAVIRDKASKALKKPKPGFYNGISGKYLGFYIMKPVWWARKIITYPVKVVKWFYDILTLFIRHLYSKYVLLPIINIKSKQVPRLRFQSARSHLVNYTDKSFEKCKSEISKIVEKVNLKADGEALITLNDEGREFSIRRAGLEVKFYKAGDGYIRANDINGYPQTFSFSMEVVEYPFGQRLWKINNKIMTIESACIYIMDSFILLAH
ncbi:TPA: hypothetical protein JC757_002756 [Salmonella enterica subsp. diarizonae]|nr:hypothetical protein [Salmonella enterica]EAX3524286.1 hypothetical protein [Salmonella enterica]HAU2958955.1 hypothetical protein [Salmonella enterica subsp. diarizonae]